MSWALLHATCRAINTITIEQYLSEAWDFTNSEIEEWNRYTVHLCAAHMIHLFSSKFKTEDRNLKRYVMYCFARLQNCRELDKATDLFRSISIRFSHQKVTDEVQEALNILNDAIKQTQDNETETGGRQYQEGDVKKLIEEQTTMRDRPPFFQHFNYVYRLCTADTNDFIDDPENGNENNPNFAPTALKAIHSFLHLYPVWSGMLLPSGKTRETISIAEVWMRISKNFSR